MNIKTVTNCYQQSGIFKYINIHIIITQQFKKQTEMSSSKQKQKKPYLKRGTRQFLSNAQVRSQSSKPKIVDFGADQYQQQYTGSSALQIRSTQNVNPNTDDIKIRVGPASAKNIPTPNNNNNNNNNGKGSAFAMGNQQGIRKNQRPPIMNRNADTSAGKSSAVNAKRDTSLGKKKKQTTLDDYLDNQSHGHDQYMDSTNKKGSNGLIGGKGIVETKVGGHGYGYKKNQPKNNNSLEEDRGNNNKFSKQQSSSSYQNNVKPRHTELVQQQYDHQDEQDQDQAPNFMQNDSFKPIKNPIVKNKQYTTPTPSSISKNTTPNVPIDPQHGIKNPSIPKKPHQSLPQNQAQAQSHHQKQQQQQHNHKQYHNDYDDKIDHNSNSNHDDDDQQLQIVHHQYCNQVNFISDKSEGEEDQLPRFNNKSKNNNNNNPKNNKHQVKGQYDQQQNNKKQQQNYMKNNYNQEQQQQNNQYNMNQNNAPVVSKVKMNYFNKNNNNNKSIDNKQQADGNTVPLSQYTKKQPGAGGGGSSASITNPSSSTTHNNNAVVSINQIPTHIKQQIIKQTIAQKQQELTNQLQKLKDKFQMIKKEKEKLEEDQKNMKKQRAQFQKEMEQKNKQFQQKIKNQNSKLMRQKKYMKDAQMSGQGDRKYKNQLQQVKKLLDKEKQQRKKTQSKYKVQIQNLRKKLGEQASKNKLLSQQIKLLEYGQILHKEQLQDMAKQQKKNIVQVHKIGMWADAPQSTFVTRFFDQDFTLIQFDLDRYQYDQNEYYHYYLKTKDQESILESETSDQDKIKRYYKNGKVEVEHIKKFIKEVFPFNYTIVHLWNGDIKQLLPEGVMIYYSQNSQVTQYSIKTQQVEKQIFYFPNREIVQMTVTKLNNNGNTEVNYSEAYHKGHLKREFQDGTVVYLKKDNKGKIMKVTKNN